MLRRRVLGAYVDVEGLTQLDLQELFDDAMDIKTRVADRVILPTWYWCTYILKWQSSAVSGAVVLLFGLAVWTALACDAGSPGELPAAGAECVPIIHRLDPTRSATSRILPRKRRTRVAR